jgi:hypothetical protein
VSLAGSQHTRRHIVTELGFVIRRAGDEPLTCAPQCFPLTPSRFPLSSRPS